MAKLNLDSIEKFPQAHYEINVGWDYVEDWLKGQEPLDLDPDFQRMHVWKPDQQTAYVEFILRGGESSRVLYWNHPNWMGSFEGKLTLIDGKQRLEAVRAFLRNEVPVFGGHLFSDLDARSVRIAHADFRMRVASLKTRKDELNWYLAINAGGTPHSKKELDRVRALLAKEP